MFKKIRNRLHRLIRQNYIGGEGINFLFFKFLPRCKKACKTYYKNKPVYFSITAIIYNEAKYIKEWIEYHKILGAERFYIYDNGSTDNVKQILEPYIKSGLVCYHFLPGYGMQNKAYRDAVYKYKNQTRWMAFIDLDEFIVPIEKNTIPDFLKDYENYPGVCINWQVFDSNGYITPPVENYGLVIANYNKVSKDDNILINRHVKTIANPKLIKTVNHPHFCYFESYKFPVDENFKQVVGPFTDFHSSKKIKINHYATKSKEEYEIKISKGCADSKKKRAFDESILNFQDYKIDTTIQKYVPELINKLYKEKI